MIFERFIEFTIMFKLSVILLWYSGFLRRSTYSAIKSWLLLVKITVSKYLHFDEVWFCRRWFFAADLCILLVLVLYMFILGLSFSSIYSGPKCLNDSLLSIWVFLIMFSSSLRLYFFYWLRMESIKWLWTSWLLSNE